MNAESRSRSETDNADFVMEFYAALAISGAAQITITADPNVVATEKRVREMISEHDKDQHAHVDVISAALSAAIKRLEDSGQIMDEAAAEKFVREMLDQYGAAKDISFEDTYETGASNLQQALDVVLGNTLPKLTVTTTAGSALTLTDGQSTITGTATGGSFTTTLPRLGEWTVTASLAGLTTDDTITVDVVGGKYTLTLPYFAATLNVTTAPDAVVTATLPTRKGIYRNQRTAAATPRCASSVPALIPCRHPRGVPPVTPQKWRSWRMEKRTLQLHVFAL